MAAQNSKRTRLAPEARRSQLLDSAREIIEQDGLPGFTMEALARRADVSNPLVYKYFTSRVALLSELLEREYQEFADEIALALRSTKTFEEVVRVFVNSNFDHHTPGNILPVLMSQSELSSVLRAREKKDNRATAKFLIASISESYSLTGAQAELLISISSGASISAAGYRARTNANREATVDFVMQYIFAGIRSLAEPDGR